MSDKLVIEVEIPDFNVEGIQQAADEYCDGDVHYIVTEELMRQHVGLTLVTIPGEKSLNSDFEIHSRVGKIIGAHIVSATDADASPQKAPDANC